MIMKKTIIAIIGALVLSFSLTTAIYARAIEMSRDMEVAGRRSKCAVEVTTGGSCLKCMPGGGCIWGDGSAVTYGGRC